MNTYHGLQRSCHHRQRDRPTAGFRINGLAVADRGITEADGLLLGHEEFDVITKTALIAFQGQDVIRLLVDDLLRDLALASYSVDGDDGTFDGQQVPATLE